jgi:hypothetical protein
MRRTTDSTRASKLGAKSEFAFLIAAPALLTLAISCVIRGGVKMSILGVEAPGWQGARSEHGRY